MKKLQNARPCRCFPTLALLIASGLALAGCFGGKERPTIASPPLAELRAESEPQLDVAAVEQDSAAALDDYDARHAAWGRRGWDQVRRICVWFRDIGAPTPDCAPHK